MSLVTLADAKQYLRISHASEDAILQIMLDDVEDWVQRYCGTYFGTTLTHTDDVAGGTVILRPPSKPITGVTSVTDVETDTAYTDFHYDLFGVWRDDELIWEPGLRRWRIVYTGGFTSATIPAGMKLAIMDVLYRVYQVRGGQAGESGPGYTQAFSQFETGDVALRLRPYRYSLPIW